MKLYRSYVVRCWQEVGGELPVWRFALIQVGYPFQTRGFPAFEELARFLLDELTFAAQTAVVETTETNAPEGTHFTQISQGVR